MTKRYDSVESVDMEKLFPSNYFRLINGVDRKMPKGYSEIPVKIYLKKNFVKDLSFKVPWDGELYGFVRNKVQLFEKTGYDNTVLITISDWEDKFTIIFEDAHGIEKPVYDVNYNEMKALLEECIKPEKL
ncbi:MAG: hypothetical protein R3Y09_09320 [Clostridia bacterium]